MVRKILKYGEPVLEQAAQPVTEFDTPELNEIIQDMWETMYAAKGVGLAAPQIGLGLRISVIDTSVGEDETKKLVIINPEISFHRGQAGGRRRMSEYSRLSRARVTSQQGNSEGA